MIKWAHIDKSSGKIPTSIYSKSKIALEAKPASQLVQDPV